MATWRAADKMDISLQHQFCLAYLAVFLGNVGLPHAYVDLTEHLLTGKDKNECG